MSRKFLRPFGLLALAAALISAAAPADFTARADTHGSGEDSYVANEINVKLLRASDLQGQSFVHFERDIPTRRATDRILRTHGVTVQRAAEFDNIETIKRAVEVGLGVAIVPRPSVLDEQRTKQLAVVPLAEPEWQRSVGVIYRSDRVLSTAASKFVELLKQ